MRFILRESPVYGVYYHIIFGAIWDRSEYCWISREPAPAKISSFTDKRGIAYNTEQMGGFIRYMSR